LHKTNSYVITLGMATIQEESKNIVSNVHEEHP